MEPTQGTQATTPVASSTSSTGLLGTKIPSSIAFLLAILLFLLPFAEIDAMELRLQTIQVLALQPGQNGKRL